MNPFKLWGSYVGLVVGLAGSYLSFGFAFYLAEIGKFEPWGFFVLFSPPVIGFLLGWLLHEFFYWLFSR